jgi:hypothetical protein
LETKNVKGNSGPNPENVKIGKGYVNLNETPMENETGIHCVITYEGDIKTIITKPGKELRMINTEIKYYLGRAAEASEALTRGA